MKLIVACDPNGGIGYQNKLPWDKIQGDLPRFKQLTEDKIVVMGRNTFDSLPIKPLPKRANIVISNNTQLRYPEGVLVTNDLERIKDYDVWLIGGAKLIESCWHKINEVYLTKTFAEYTCDVFIDLLYLEKNFACELTEKFEDHVFQIWKRK